MVSTGITAPPEKSGGKRRRAGKAGFDRREFFPHHSRHKHKPFFARQARDSIA
jgi:hypothetical protein